MKFFVDTADLTEIKKIQAWFSLDGVTTNPTLIAQSGQKQDIVIRSICEAVPGGSVSAEVLSTDAEGMCQEAQDLKKIHPQVVIKIPLIKEGLIAVKKLSEQNIPTNVTLCFSALQALMAAHAGATIVSIFVGRLDDIGVRGIEVAEEAKQMFSQYQLKTQVLVASVRHTTHISEAAQIRADIVTIPPALFSKMVTHPLTDTGLKQFLESAKSIQLR